MCLACTPLAPLDENRLAQGLDIDGQGLGQRDDGQVAWDDGAASPIVNGAHGQSVRHRPPTERQTLPLYRRVDPFVQPDTRTRTWPDRRRRGRRQRQEAVHPGTQGGESPDWHRPDAFNLDSSRRRDQMGDTRRRGLDQQHPPTTNHGEPGAAMRATITHAAPTSGMYRAALDEGDHVLIELLDSGDLAIGHVLEIADPMDLGDHRLRNRTTGETLDCYLQDYGGPQVGEQWFHQ
jgi:hypothetical protein